MGSRGLKLGRIFGVDVSLDLGVLPLLGILSFLLASSILPSAAPGHVSLTYWTVAIVISILFVASLLIHELSHSLVANKFGIPVRGIVLWLFGGVSEMDRPPDTPGRQFAISVAGPAASIVFGLVSIGGSVALERADGPAIYVAALHWLGLVNLVLGAFNLLPGVPLDGGHVVAAAVWKLRGDQFAGQIAAAMAGRFLGLALAGFGVFELSSAGSWIGVWNIGLGLMLHQSARYQEQSIRLERAIGDKTVSELMDANPRSASSLATISQVVRTTLESDHQSAVPIVNWSGRVVAVVELSDLYAVPKDRWDDTTAVAAAGGRDDFITATPTEKVSDVLSRMGRAGRRHAAVVTDGALIGLIGPEQIVGSMRS